MEDINSVTRGDIQQLLLYFSKNTYRAKENDSVCQEVMQKCLDLVSVDYSHVVVNNTSGELSANYPSQLIIIEYERMEDNSGSEKERSTTGSLPKVNSTNPPDSSVLSPNSIDGSTQGTIYENVYDANKLRDLFGKARFARCRARFPLPVIFFRGKHICRSATLSGGPEIYGRSGLDYLFSGEEASGNIENCEEEEESAPTGDWQLFDRVRNQDIRLLQTLNVGTIVDLMVEKKKVKFGVNVTSSEKVDKENRYSDFKIVSLPYPGCEFFKEYRDNDYVAKGLVFDWNQTYVDAALGVPDEPLLNQLQIDWNNYKLWDLVKLTQNYVKLLLKYLVEQSTGLLVHCISGWDRTPLFVSLLRLSLWADGVIHQSLTPQQILYFTIAYDWMLFGHNLQDRLSKGEDIFFFCFYILKHLVGEEYSVTRTKPSSKQNNSSVLRTDSDSQLDGVLFEQDTHVSSQDSNVSLNSSWSSISSKSQEPPTTLFNNDDTNGNSYLFSNYNSSMMECDGLYNPCRSHPRCMDVPSKDTDCEMSPTISTCSSFSSNSSSTERSNSTLPTVIGAQHPNTSVFPVNSSGTMNSNNSRCQFTNFVDNDSECNVTCKNDSSLCCNGNIQQRCPGSPPNSPPSTAKIHTSPVAVPSRTPLRQRNESSSSLSVGSWQFISGTGSLRGSSSNSTCDSQSEQQTPVVYSTCEGGSGSLITDSTTTLIEDDCFIYSNGAQDPVLLRRERLRKVRELFYHSYCSTIGLKTKDGSESGISHFLGNFAEKVGIRSTQRTSV